MGKVSERPQTTTVNDADQLLTSQSGVSKYLEAQHLFSASSARIKSAYEAASSTTYSDEKDQVITQMLSTGWRGAPPVLSANANPALFDHTEGNLEVIDNTTSPATITVVNIPAATGVSPTLIASETATFYSAGAGGLVARNKRLTAEQRRSQATIGLVSHIDNVNIDDVVNTPQLTTDVASNVHDLMRALGFFSTGGNTVSPVAASMTLNKAVGTGFALHENANLNAKDPHNFVMPALSPMTLVQILQDASVVGTSSIIDSTNYDLSGVLTAVVGGNSAQIARIYAFPNNSIVFMFGQEVFASVGAAELEAGKESFIEPSDIAEGALLLARLVIKNNTTDASNTSNFKILPNTGISAGGASVADLQEAYDVSLPTAEIETNSTQGALTLKRGSAADTDEVFEVKNGAGSQVFTVSGEGVVKAGSALDVISPATVLNATYYVDPNGSDLNNGTMTSPFQTIQFALDSFGAPVDAADERVRKQVIVASGAYDEDLTIPHSGVFILTCDGVATLGDASLINNGSSVARTISWEDQPFGGDFGQLRPTLVLNALTTAEPTSTHPSYVNGWTISGGITLTTLSSAGSTELHMHNVKVIGQVNTTARAGSLGIFLSNVMLDSSLTAFGAGTEILHRADRCEFDGLISVAQFGRMTYCEIGAGMTVTATPSTSFRPAGMYSSRISGTFTGVASSYLIDNITYNISSPTLAGGATLDLIDAKGFTEVDAYITEPVAALNVKLIKVPVDNSITLKRAYFYCDAATNCVFNIEERANPTVAGTDIWTVDKTATTTEASTTSFDNASIAAGSYLYITITSVTGTPVALGITLEYYED